MASHACPPEPMMGAQPRIRKRPAAAKANPVAPKQTRPISRQRAIPGDPADFGVAESRPTWYYQVGGAPQPEWAQHFLNVLRDPIRNLKDKFGDEIRLVLWADCVGECTEGISAKPVADVLMKEFGIRLTIKLHAGCDNTRHCEKFVQHNFDPSHFSNDIFKRDFDRGTFECTMCGGLCPLPMVGVDLYWGCFPCGPWSKRGKRRGPDDKHSDVVWQVIKTINYLNPVIYVMENVLEIGSGDADDDLSAIKEFMDEQFGDGYHTLNIQGVTPKHHGYVVQKERLLLIGGRNDQVCKQSMMNVFNQLNEHPIPVVDTYWTFLGCEGVCAEILDGVGQVPSPYFSVRIHETTCNCGIDPMIVCPVHPCFCDKCKAGEQLQCSWRHKMMKYLADKNLTNLINDGCLTYMQALELDTGTPLPIRNVPQSARERNLLNVFARLPAAQPLRSTLMILDISQAIDRCHAKTDGTVPTMATNAKMWSIRAGRALEVVEMAKLMGHDLADVNLRGTSENQMRHMLGMSMHVTTAGYALTGLLGAIGSSRIS